MKKIPLLALALTILAGGVYGWVSFGPKTATLTFDDGPEDTATDEKILAILRKHHARAIWFITCARLDPTMDSHAADHQRILRQIVAEGHQLGNHGYSHLNLVSLEKTAPYRLAHEISGCSQAISTRTGVTPKYFRPPWGRYTPLTQRLVEAEGMKLMLWSGDSFDHLLAKFKKNPQLFVPFVTQNPSYDITVNAKSGNIILFHDYPNTAAALDEILTKLEGRGFRFVLPDVPPG